ncbi:MAG: AAA family ATPase, partial [Lachnospiraceae bacterium]|nr:AAA family ATPase [Lachnospiraceae bacterium]
MYESYFEMQHTPFTRNLPPESLYEPAFIGDVLGRLGYVADRQLFAVMTADPGCGKSTVLRKFAASLPSDQYVVLYLSDSKMTPRWFYKGLLEQMGLESRYYRGDARKQLHKEIEILRGVKKKQVVVILDEAHLLEKETLEEFRFLLNFSFDSVSPMALILSGQTELLDKLRLRRYDALRQRIDIFCSLPHLDRSETEEYIRSHLKYAACTRELFTDKAIDEVYKGSTGVSRMINRICEKSLMYASQQ